MFAFFSALLVVALAQFGAVQPYAYLSVEILWLIALWVVVAKGTLRDRRLGLGTLAYAAVCSVSLLIDHELALWFLAAGWGWLATRKHPLKSLSFLKFLIVLGVLEAFLGLIQYFVAPGWIFGYQNRFYVSSGTLINRNHFAGLLEMIVPAAVAFAFAAIVRGREIARGYFFLFVGALISIAIVFSTSRMGLFCCLLTLLFLGAALRLKSTNRRSNAVSLAVLGLVVTGALWIGIDVIVQRFSQLSSEDALLREGRAEVYKDTIRMIAERPLGIGPGRYSDVFRKYQTFRPDLLMDHTHNDYLETIAEWGVVPGVVFWVVIFVIFVRAFRAFLRTQSVERTTVLMASLGAIFSILLHSLADFNLQIPSNAMLFFLFVGMAAQASMTAPFPVAEKN